LLGVYIREDIMTLLMLRCRKRALFIVRAAPIDNPTAVGRATRGRHFAPGAEEVRWLERA
jgi:hypothetical protein